MSQPPGGPGSPGAPGDPAAQPPQAPPPSPASPHDMPTQLAGAAATPPPPGAAATPPPPGAVPPPPGAVPPPPPGQPPQSAPPQPQYGYPAQQPGYGYPQQPAAQGGQNPYAQPVQQPGYGFPQQPATQPMQQQGWGGNPYGQPQQPPYPGMPDAAGGKRLAGGKLAGVIAGVVAAVLVIGGGVWMLTSGGNGPKPQPSPTGSGSANPADPTDNGDNTPHNAQGKVQWTVPAPTVTKEQNIAPTPGMWFSGGDVIKPTPTAVTAYNLSSGQQHWSVPLPSGNLCSSANDAVNNKVAVLYGANCGSVMVIDVSTGKAAWNKPMPNPPGSHPFFEDMAMSGDTVAVTVEGQTAAFQVSTGNVEWQSHNGSDARDKGFAGGSQMVEVYYTGWDLDKNNHVSLIDPATGKAKWTWDAPAGTAVTSVISTNPVVVGIAAGDSQMTDIWNVDGGRLSGKIPLGRGASDEGKYAIRCPSERMSGCRNVAVSGSTLYMATTQQSGGGDKMSDVNQVAAFDLSSGNARWLSKSADNLMDVVMVDGNSVIAYQESDYDHGGKVIKVDTSTGALSTYTTFDDSTQPLEHEIDGHGVDETVAGWHNNTMVLSLAEIFSGGDDKNLMAAMH